jgi:hypothetical protein
MTAESPSTTSSTQLAFFIIAHGEGNKVESRMTGGRDVGTRRARDQKKESRRKKDIPSSSVLGFASSSSSSSSS